jgi:putative aminopeptidase FrvX
MASVSKDKRKTMKSHQSAIENPALEKISLPDAFINLLSLLMRSPSVVGAEHSFFRVLQRELEERGAKVTWYEGLLVAEGNRPDSLFLSAHIDRHGLICTGPQEFQYAAFVAGARSDLLGNSVGEQLLRKVAGRFTGEPVFAYEPWSGAYRGRGSIKKSYVCEFRNNLIFELNDMDYLVAGTPVAFLDKLKVTDKALVGQLDNVLTAAVLVYLFECGFQGTAFFTAQEEAGKSWRYLLEWFRRFGGSTNQLIVVDTSPYPDFEAAAQQQLVLRNKDANAIFNQALTAKLATLCEQLNITSQYKDRYVEQRNIELIAAGQDPMSLGSTELGRIIAASNGLVDGTTLQIPTSGYHTMSETAPLEAVSAFIQVLTQLASKPA